MSSLLGLLPPLLLPLTLFFYKRALVPLYASVPTNVYFEEIVLAAVVLSVAASSALPQLKKKNHGRDLYLYASITFLLAPNAVYWVPVYTARWKDPFVGPSVTHLATLLPLVVAHTLPVMSEIPLLWQRILVAGLASGLPRYTKNLWESWAYLNKISETQYFFALSTICILIYIFSMPVPNREVIQKRPAAGKKTQKTRTTSSTSDVPPIALKFLLFLAYLIGLSITHPIIKSPVLPHPLTSRYKDRKYPVEILSSEQSVTGLVVVGQALPPPPNLEQKDWPSQIVSARYLRAAHSILGGVWTDNLVGVLDWNDTSMGPLVDIQGKPLGDSIYGVFVVQEAVRMVDSTVSARKSDEEKHALVIGLGAGISTTSLIRHGIKTDIIEIDPAVYRAARNWFALPDPYKTGGQVFLEDARGWVRKAKKSKELGKYDVVIHDCFSGGGVPEQLYSVEFLKDLMLILEEGGVVVVNLVGQVDSISTRMVLATLEAVVGPCRAFHDLMDVLPVEKYKTEYHNIVFFCSSEPITFRKSVSKDWLGSPLRRHILSDLKGREVDLGLIRDFDDGDERYVVTDENNRLNRIQEEHAPFHWKLMRGVLDHFFWEVY